MRLAGISSITDANAWIDGFTESYNARFSRPPRFPVDVHRSLTEFDNLDDIFTWQEQRSLSASLTLQYDKVLYLVDPTPQNQRLAGKRVTVVDYPDGRIKIRYEGSDLAFRQFDKIYCHKKSAASNALRAASPYRASGPDLPGW